MYSILEKPTLEFDIASDNVLIQLIECNLEEIVSLKFQKVVFNLYSALNIERLLVILDKIKFNNLILVFRIMPLVEVSIRRKQLLNEIGVVVNVIRELDVVENYVKRGECVEIEFNANDYVSIINHCIEKDIIQDVVFSPIIKKNGIERIVEMIDYVKGKKRDLHLMFNVIIFQSSLLREHPCNMFLCRGEKCHSKLGNIPRHIVVDTSGNLYPYNIRSEKLHMGDICGSSISETLIKYESGIQHKNFIELNKKVFLCVFRNYPYAVIPWFEYLKEHILYE